MTDVTLHLSYDAFAAIRGALERYSDHVEAFGFAIKKHPDVTPEDLEMQAKLTAQVREAITVTDAARTAIMGSST